MLLRKFIFFKPAIALSILFFGVNSFVYSQSKSSLTSKDEVQTTITYCDLALSESWKLANLTFNLLYSFSVNEKGEIVGVKKIRDDFVGEEKVKSCLSNWKINGVLNKSPFVVYFTWRHGKGWVEQKISGKGFKQTMSMEDVGVDKSATSENVNY